MNRRDFIAAVGGLPALVEVARGDVSEIPSSTTTSNEYKALVCVLLKGGIDSFNLLFPFAGDPLMRFDQWRPAGTFARPVSGTSINFGYGTGASSGFAVNSQSAFVNTNTTTLRDDVAFVSNVGSLVEPITMSEFRIQIQGKSVPRALASHNDQIRQLQTLDHLGRNATGWLDRIYFQEGNNDLLKFSPFSNLSSQGNFAQMGRNRASFSFASDGGASFSDEFSRREGQGEIGQLEKLERIWDHSLTDKHLLRRRFAEISREATRNSEGFNDIFAGITLVGNARNSNAVRVVKAMKTGIALGLKRQTFVVEINGWDHHSNIANAFPAMLENLNGFLADLRTLCEAEDGATPENDNLWREVVAFTVSDFGRAIRPNSTGTDHGWGGNHVVMGGDVRPGLWGKPTKMLYFEDLEMSSGELDLSDSIDSTGRFLPSTSWDEYYATLARWFGVPASADGGSSGPLFDALPNYEKFTNRVDDPSVNAVNDLAFLEPHEIRSR